MSRIGNMPVVLPDGIDVTIDASRIVLKNAKDSSEMIVPEEITVEKKDNTLLVRPRLEGGHAQALWGTVRSRLASLVTGLSGGVTIALDINGVGYRAALKGADLSLQLGFSHDVTFPIPEGIAIKCPNPTRIEISGRDKQLVGQVAAEIRSFRKPEPYKGKGVKYEGEIILRKEGKKK